MVKGKSVKKEPEIIMEYDFDRPKVVMEEKRVKILQKEKQGEKIDVKKREKKEQLKQKIENPVNGVIKDLLDSERTFVKNITRNKRNTIFSSFYPFPKNISFLTVGKEEAVILVVRRHWSTLTSRALLALFAIFFPFLISYSVPSWFESAIGSALFMIGLFIFFVMLAITIMLDGFFKWFYGLNMITNKRVIDIDFTSISTHRIAETTLEQVQDVSHRPAGPLASFFDYGHLFIQTAGTKNEFEFNNIPRPRDVQDTILDLRELRRARIAKGE